MKPSAREIVLISEPVRKTSRNRTTSITVIRRSRGKPLVRTSFFMRIGRMRAATPMRSRMFTILLPMTLPSNMSDSPLIIDEIETASSGVAVPKLTIVMPTMNLLTLKWEAILEAPSINQSAPLTRMMKPTTRRIICNTISIYYIIT